MKSQIGLLNEVLERELKEADAAMRVACPVRLSMNANPHLVMDERLWRLEAACANCVNDSENQDERYFWHQLAMMFRWCRVAGFEV